MSDVETMLQQCEEAAEFDDNTSGPSTPRKPTFNKWERGFLDDIREQWNSVGRLSVGQEDKLRELWDKT